MDAAHAGLLSGTAQITAAGKIEGSESGGVPEPDPRSLVAFRASKIWDAVQLSRAFLCFAVTAGAVPLRDRFCYRSSRRAA